MKVHKVIWHNAGDCKNLTELDAIEKALSLSRGRYQSALINGWQAWSGADLKGNAAKYMNRYRESRFNLLRRIETNKIPCIQYTTDHNKIEIAFGKRNISKIRRWAVFTESLRDKKSDSHYVAKAIDSLINAIKNMHDGDFTGYSDYNKNIKRAKTISIINIIEK